MSFSPFQETAAHLTAGDDLGRALLIIGAVLLATFVLPFVMAWLEPDRTEQPRHRSSERRGEPRSLPRLDR